MLERGTYLANSIVACGNCHTAQAPKGPDNAKEFAGRLLEKIPPFTAYASNITPDKETGIGTWTKAQLIRALREGIRPDGSLIGPPMPIGVYSKMSDRDVEAIAEYVMSRKPIKNKVPPSIYRIKLPPHYGPPVKTVAKISRINLIKYGEYLAGPLGHCTVCHTPMVKGRRDFANQVGRGGFTFKGPWGVSVAANITPHKTDGIAGHATTELAKLIRSGMRSSGARMLPPMGYAY